jgi:hypothetical protein
MSAFQLILDDDANSLKDSFVLVHAAAELIIENPEILDSPIEGFMASLSTIIESFDQVAI